MATNLPNETVSRIADQKPCAHEWVRAGEREASVWLCLQCGTTSDTHPLTALDVPKENNNG